MLDALFTAIPFAQASASGGLGQVLFMVVAFGGIMYFLMIRPQQQQRRKHEEMVSAIKRGDKVIMQGGLYGKVTHVGDDILNIEIAPDVVVEQMRSMIMTVEAKPEPQSKKADAKKTDAKAASAKKPAAKKAPAKKTTSSRAKKAPADTAK